jgi:transcriptional regulator with XRE-family HTH domain
MTGTAAPHRVQEHQPIGRPFRHWPRDIRLTVSPPGVIGGALIRAARHSVKLARHELAQAIGLDNETVRDLEHGETALFCVPYDLLRQVAGALARPGSALTGGVGELVTAANCDLLVTAMLCGFEDYAEVPPIDQNTPDGALARDLLRWALAGVVPDRYRPTATARRLLAARERFYVATIARSLSAGARGPELAEFGLTLAMLATDEQSRGGQQR